MTTRASINAGYRRQIIGTIMAHALAVTGQGDGVYTAPCYLCGTLGDRRLSASEPNRLEAGHIVSANNGGRFALGNLVPECRACQNGHGDRDITEVATLRWTPAPAGLPMVARTSGRSITDETTARRALWLAPTERIAQ